MTSSGSEPHLMEFQCLFFYSLMWCDRHPSSDSNWRCRQKWCIHVLIFATNNGCLFIFLIVYCFVFLYLFLFIDSEHSLLLLSSSVKRSQSVKFCDEVCDIKYSLINLPKDLKFLAPCIVYLPTWIGGWINEWFATSCLLVCTVMASETIALGIHASLQV